MLQYSLPGLVNKICIYIFKKHIFWVTLDFPREFALIKDLGEVGDAPNGLKSEITEATSHVSNCELREYFNFWFSLLSRYDTVLFISGAFHPAAVPWRAGSSTSRHHLTRNADPVNGRFHCFINSHDLISQKIFLEKYAKLWKNIWHKKYDLAENPKSPRNPSNSFWEKS